MERLDKTAVRVTDLGDESHDREFWWSQTPEYRVRELLRLRQMMYGRDRATARLQRVLRVVELGEDEG